MITNETVMNASLLASGFGYVVGAVAACSQKVKFQGLILGLCLAGMAVTVTIGILFWNT